LDADLLVVVGDRLTLRSDRAALAASLVKVGVYWRRFQQFDRALERLNRAIELDPKSATAHQAAARTHWNILAAQKLNDNGPALTDAQQRRFNDALSYIRQAQLLLPAKERNRPDVLYDFGATYFAARQFSEAVTHLTGAVDKTDSEARELSREPDWDCHYALACVYARMKRYTDALEILKVLAGKRKRWDREKNQAIEVDYVRYAYDEPDFAEWFNNKDWEPYLREALGPRPT
jgi:tetratricopeptide (TPR) repeat protein